MDGGGGKRGWDIGMHITNGFDYVYTYKSALKIHPC